MAIASANITQNKQNSRDWNLISSRKFNFWLCSIVPYIDGYTFGINHIPPAKMQSQTADETFSNVFPKAAQTIRAASALAAQDVAFCKSVDANLGKDIDSAAKRVLAVANRLFEAGGEPEDLLEYGADRIEGEANWKRVSNALDNIFEKIDSAFDELKNGGSSGEPKQTLTYLEGSAGDSNDIKHTGKRLTKPQNDFRVKVDTTETGPFKPRLTSKPHALIPYEETMTLLTPKHPGDDDDDEEVDPAYYAQPYEKEIDTQPYPEAIYSTVPPIPFNDWHETSATWVDTVEKLHEMIKELSTLKEIAVDLEHHDYRTYYGIVCLMQISNREKDWIVDTLALRDDLEPLNEVFTNPEIIKVFHGAFMDIIWLQRDLGLYVVSLFDTFHASKKLGFPKFSLAYLLEHFAKFKTSKKYQLADWRIRPLLSPMLAYARSDTHFLLNIFDQLRNLLLESDDEKMKEVLYESRQVAKRRFEYTKYRPIINTKNVTCPVMAYNPREPYGSIISQYNVPFHKKPLVEALYNWRDSIARQEDESVRYILPNQLLVNLVSLSLPVDASKIMNCGTYVTEHVRIHVKELADLINSVSQKMEVNDWELVEKWNRSTDSLNETAAFGNSNEEDLNAVAKVFDDLKANFSTSDSLLKSESVMVTSPFKMRYTVHYDVKSNKPIESHDLEERKGRLQESLEKIEAEVITIDNIDEKEEAETAAPEEVDSKTDIAHEEKKEDPNEIITLRKKKQTTTKTEPSRLQQSASSDAFDYANADKILLDTSQRNRANFNKKKRAFDPYGEKESLGPQGAKRNKRNISGKTSTFSNKRR